MNENLILKTENVKFLTSLPQIALQDIKTSFEVAHWDTKNYWNSPASLWNSIIVTILLHVHIFLKCFYITNNFLVMLGMVKLLLIVSLNRCSFCKIIVTTDVYYVRNVTDGDWVREDQKWLKRIAISHIVNIILVPNCTVVKKGIKIGILNFELGTFS